MKKELKIFCLIFTTGYFVYPGLEQIFGFFVNLIVVPLLFCLGITPHFTTGKSFCANVAIGILGGVALYVLGKINEWFKDLHRVYQYFIGYCAAVSVEWVGGLIINGFLKLDGWNYKWLPLSSPDGQVNLFFSLIWLAIMPFAFWLDDEIKKRYNIN